MRASLSYAALLATFADAQQLYLTTDGYTDRPQCTKPAAVPQYHFRSFSYTLNETVRYASSVHAPTTTRTYAPPYSEAVKHLTASPVTTTWGNWLPSQTVITATDTDDPYGQAAWSSLWEQVDLENYTTTGLYSTTVNPTAIPSSELILPPRDYFGPTDCYNFPDDFIFGVAGSAAQVEGAIGLEGRSPTILETLVNTTQPKNYVTNENYYLYKQDIQRLAAMGVKYYSFSIPWTRILPFVLPGSPVNEQGIRHYDDLINTVLDAGMQPIVTLLHFDSPLMFVGSDNTSAHPDIGYNNGGYQNETFVDAFVNYAKIVLTHYADRVPIWITFNEPLLYSFNFAGANNVVHAHAQVYHFYHEELNATGKIGIKFNDNFGVPRDPTNSSDIIAANRFQEMQLGLYANPIFLGQQYPDSVLTTLPGAKPLSDQDLAYIGNTSDFFGIDPYTATVVSQPVGGIESCAKNQSTGNSLFPYCVMQETKNIYGWNIGYRSQSYVYITPTYLREYINYLWNTFRKPVFVTEFGFPVSHEADLELSDQLFDTPRSIYYLSFMSEILKAIHEDGVNVMGALAWSWADNWEFGDYKQQFGLQVVNRTTQQRFFKKSFFDLVDFVGARLPPSS
ncbi:glycoside hydrolase superfamily [Aspergillus pseudonomiae]|uniref:Glycoside hydrolase superfamily n=1 Tax=Aspergillus pseudonomiae TaxID=1506151 RepID=A0A5N7DA98_9EURO|nr:glycoside hydrolase superfamily [Aspergillus pseudonomiae]KAE8403267.1 glycoside hydrolase superfamily [Aspergillus pseudonomiae]